MKDVLNKIIDRWSPLAVFLGGSRGSKFSKADSDIDIIIVVDEASFSYCYQTINEIHYITTSIEREMNTSGLLFLEQILYCCTPSLYQWFQHHLQELNTIHLLRNDCYHTAVYSPRTYKIIAYYNYYYNDNQLLDIREPNCQYHDNYRYILNRLHQDLANVSIDQQKLIQSFYEAARGDK